MENKNPRGQFLDKGKQHPVKRILILLLAFILLIQTAPMEALAVWDGSGNSGSTSTSPVSGAYLLYSGYGNDMTKHIMGYRFSVYDSEGNKLGHSVDIDCNRYLIETVGLSVYRSGSSTDETAKQSHIDLYKAYLRNPSAVSISPLHVVTSSHSETYLNARYIYYDDTGTLASCEPSEIGDEWLTDDMASYVAVDLCGASSYDWATCFIICEPLWTVRLHDYYYYALTMAELAVYQSGPYAAGSWTDIPSSALVNGLYCANVGSYTSAAFGRYLYATGNYTALGTTPVGESAHLAQDKYGTDSVLFQQSTYSSWNTAEDVLKYQIGMAVYTGKAEDPITCTVDFHYHFREEGSATAWEEDTSLASSVTFDAGSKFRVRTYAKSVSGYGVPTIEQDGTGTLGTGTTLTAAAQVTVNSNIRIDYYYDHSKYKITCDMQEGSGGTESFYEYYSVRFQETSTSTTAITSITIPTRDGYTFIGYYTEEDGGGTRVVDNTGSILATNTDFTANTTIYAYWIKPICEITCDKGEGTGGTSTFYEVFGYRFSLSSAGTGSITSITIPTWAGHTFQGYYTEENGKGDLIVNSSGRIMVANTYFKDDATIYAHWTEAKYTITWVNYDGTVLETDTDVSYGETPSYDGSTPVKSITGYLSTFTGWSPSVSTVTGNATYTAQFSDVAITYQVRYNANGGTGTMSNSTHTYGTAKNLSANLFTRTGYVFKGWATSSGSSTVRYTDEQSVLNLASTQDAIVDLYAVWEVNTYTITWVNYDGTVLETDTNVSYGATPSYDGATPTKSMTGYVSTFTGWSPAVSTVTGNATYTAQFSDVAITYQVRYNANGGTGTMSNSTHTYGTSKNLSANLFTRTGYVFKGWATSSGSSTVKYTDEQSVLNLASTQDAIVDLYAVWEVNTYTITWVNYDGTVLETDTGVQYGATPSYDGATPTKSIVGYTSTFAGWTPSVSAVTGNATYTATFDDVAISYTITYDSKGGSSVSSQSFTIETDLVLRGASTRTGYIFMGWKVKTSSGSWVAGTYYSANKDLNTGNYGDVTLEAQWGVRTYTVTWKNYDGTVLETDTGVQYGATPSYDGATPTKSIVGYTSTFAGWTPSVSAVTGNVTYTATFDDVPISYTITYDSKGGSSVSSQSFTIETDLVLRGTPTRTGYTFTGWKVKTSSGSWVAGTTYSASRDLNAGNYGNVTLEAQWEINNYTQTVKVRYQNVDGTWGDYNTVISESYAYGTTFPGWSYAADTTYEAASLASYTVVGNKTSTMDVYRQQYTVTLTKGTGIGAASHSATIGLVSGNTYYAGAIVTLSATVSTGYTWGEWTYTSSGSSCSSTQNYSFTVNEDVSYTANASLITYTITYKDEDGTGLGTKSYTVLDNFTLMEAQTKDGFNFLYWKVDASSGGWTAGTFYNGGASVSAGAYGDVTMIAQWEVAGNTPFTVNHYLENAGGTYVLNSAQERKGEKNEEVTLADYAQFFTGYKYKEGKVGNSVVTTAAILEDGSLVINLYYDLEDYQISYDSNGGSSVANQSFTVLTDLTLAGAPTKEGYTFAGWKVETSSGSWTANTVYEAAKKLGTGYYGDVTLEAQWTVNQYTITWVANGSTVKTATYHYGATVTDSHPADPTKTGYTFTGWDTAIPATMPANDVIITAQFSINQYTITWVANGSTVKTATYHYGATVTDSHPADPTKTGHTFTGWDKAIPATMPANDVTITAQFSVNSYDIIWIADGTEVKRVSYAYGATLDASHPSDPSKTGYSFTGWDTAIPATMPANNVTITAQFAVNQYKIIWVADGVTVKTATYDYGATVTDTHPANPVKDGSTFSGWDKSIPATMPANDVTITAKWDVNSYKIQWVVDGTVVKEVSYDFGATVSEVHPNNPAKTGHTFAGWDKSIPATMPANDVIITAMWTVNRYTITWVVDGAEVQKKEYAYGAAVDASHPADPSKTGYTFTGWDTAIPATMPANNVTITAQFKINQYKIQFETGGGTEIPDIIQDYGTDVTKPEDPTRPGYEFDGWDKEIPDTIPAYDMVITAQWTPIDYTITYDSNGGGSVAAQTYNADMELVLSAGPVAPDGYVFKGWLVKESVGSWVKDTLYTSAEEIGTGMYGDVTLVAQWALNEFDITWVVDGQVVQQVTYAVGDTVTATHPSNPTKTGYTFAGWDTAIPAVMPANDVVITAQFKINQYTITWVADGTTVKTATYDYGATVTATHPADPSKTGYTFAGWDKSIPATMPANDVIITAQFTVNQYNYTVYHYLQNLNGTYKLDATVNGTADYGAEVTGELKTYTPSGSFKQPAAQTITIQVSGNEIRYYYDRYSYTLTVDPNYGTWNNSYSKQTFTLIYGADMTIADPVRPGYRFDYWLVSNGACLMDEDTDLYIQGVGNCTLTAIWIPIDVEISAITFQYTDANGIVQTVTDLNNIPIGTVVSVYHTYKNNSGVTVSVNGYHGGSDGKITYEETTVFSIAAGGSKTVLADSFTVGVGSGSVSGYVYLDGYSFGDASAEHNSANNAMTVNYRGVFDVELVEIYLADTNGNRLDPGRIYEGVEVYIYHVYRNNSAQALSVDYYHNGVKYGSINSMAANSTQAVHVTSVTPSASGSITFTGAIYRKGMTATTETAEPVLSNNTKSLSATVYGKPYIENYEVSADLRVGTETITSFVVTNPGSLQFVPDMPLVVTMYVYGPDGSLLLTMTQDVVMPANETQLVWFRWEVPNVTGELTIEGKLGDTNYAVFFSECERVRKVVSNEPQFTPDTQYEDSAPSDWTQPAQPSATNGFASWSVWEYTNGTFTKVTYGISVTPGTASITPNSATAYEEYGNWYMKSGYGFIMEATGATFGALSGCIMPDAADYTDVQWAYATFPEFAYALDYTSTLELVDGIWKLYEFENYGRLHFTPIWYPDTYGTANAYCAQLVQSEIWTPVGVISVSAPTNGIYIEGNMYDDWYISGITRPEWEWTPLLFRPGDRGTNLGIRFKK